MSIEPTSFDAYSAYYDLFYSDKDYGSEALFLKSLIDEQHSKARSILELGCGTGGHAFCLAKLGYELTGIDLSLSMLERAKERRAAESEPVRQRISFHRGDVRSFRAGRSFDLVISLFHVMSYQSTNDDLRAAFLTAREHLSPGGIFVFDFWYGPAVLTERPELRTKTMKNGSFEVTRVARPALHPNDNWVDVNYEITVQDFHSRKQSSFNETHRMRYLFRPETEALLRSLGFQVVSFGEWMTKRNPGFDTWNVYIVART